MRKFSMALMAVLLSLSFVTSVAYARTASMISLETSSKTVTLGDTFTVSVTADTSEELYGVEFKITYDKNSVELIRYSGTAYTIFPSDLTSEGLLYVSALSKAGAAATNKSEIVQLEFKARQITATSTIQVVPVKGVTNEKTVNVVNGTAYPDLVQHPVIAGEIIAIQITDKQTGEENEGETGGETGGSPGGSPSTGSEVIAPSAAIQQSVQNLIHKLQNLKAGEAVDQTLIDEINKVLSELSVVVVTKGTAIEISKADIDKHLKLFESILKTLTDAGLSGRISLEKLNITIAAFDLKLFIPYTAVSNSGADQIIASVTTKRQVVKTEGISKYEPIAAYSIQFVAGAQAVQGIWSIPAGVDAELAGVYQLNEKTSKWFYVKPASHDKENIVADFTQAGTYSLMIYTRNYTDTSSTYNEAKRAIEVLTARHILQGVDDTSFAPAKNVTRAEWVAMLVRAMNWTPSDSVRNEFKDVSNDAWYAEAIRIAVAKGLTNGYSEGSFKPNAPISRAEMAVMIARLLPLDIVPGQATEQFSDDASIPAWAKDAVNMAKANGLLKGDMQNQYNPDKSTNRADAAVVLLRLLISNP